MARRDKLLSFCALSPRLDRARGHAETNYGHFASCANQKERTRQYQDDVGHSVLIIFKIFASFYSRCPETFKPSDARDSSLLGRDDRVQ